jgi:hypothetical protein
LLAAELARFYATLLGLLIAAALLFDPARTEMIDLTHAFAEKTLYWPTSPSGFEHKVLTKGKT